MTATVIPFPTKTAAEATEKATEAKPKRSSRSRPKARVEQIDVVCMRVPRRAHDDLRSVEGCLTLDYRGERCVTATFDPLDESQPNAVIPVREIERNDNGTIRVLSDEGRWTWEAVEAPDDGEDEDSDEDSDDDEE